ncbi:hypothetical protein [Novosphingobium sp. PASSN1]|uniref:hypothetical protein n=1 Tax=Novosphingobium sp. PASSN1 TaxID=2015561 RepID=UPI000BDDCA3E|nr:hypothetical protein [Novosphingobium sp. PASSN1]OYU33261.1 MAG: hypothetical protein CFE35_21030 [Novosphingobium sp. PASSN1]
MHITTSVAVLYGMTDETMRPILKQYRELMDLAFIVIVHPGDTLDTLNQARGWYECVFVIRILALVLILLQTTPEGEPLVEGYHGLVFVVRLLVADLVLNFKSTLDSGAEKVEISTFWTREKPRYREVS